MTDAEFLSDCLTRSLERSQRLRDRIAEAVADGEEEAAAMERIREWSEKMFRQEIEEVLKTLPQ